MATEAERIRAEYERREREIDQDRYLTTAPENILASHELERHAIEALRAAGKLPLRERRILDVGCGYGGWLALFEFYGARREHLTGLELMDDRAASAAERLPGADVRQGDATTLPWEDGTFEIAFQSMMFSSILDPGVRAAAAAEIARVLRPDGVLLWYDFFVSDPRNPAVTGMTKKELRRLFPGFELKLRRATLAPPLARVIVPRSRTVGALLTAMRVLDTHYVGVLSRPR